ncbi:hypothetical protein ACEPAI_7672 [Sanghuangporus weigelae]
MASDSRTNERSQRSAERTYVPDRTGGSEHESQTVLNRPGNATGVDVDRSELEDLVVQMRSMEARLVQQAERGIIAQSASRPIKFVPQDTSTQQSMVGRITNASVPSAQTMSVVLQEIQSLRTRMDEIVRHQQQEAARNFSSSSSDFDDGRTAPPSYSEDRVR